MRPARSDDDSDDVAPEFTATDSHVGATGGEALADLLLQVIAATTTLAVLLSEADEDEWRAAYPRYATFRGLVEQLPVHPRPKRRVGFKVAQKTKAKQITKKRGKK